MKKYLKFKFLFSFIIFIGFDEINKFTFKNYKNIKVCLCTIGKDENKYIIEFVEHYKKYGIDKIYLADNNDINGEYFEDKIKDYIDNGFVEIINWRGVKGSGQVLYYKVMNNCYQKHHNEYNWLLFYEIDEFLHLKNFTNAKQYLNQKKFKKCDSIRLNWVHMSDNNKIYYENKPLKERFTKVGNNVNKNKFNYLCSVKSIIRGHLKNIIINHNHLLSHKLKGCNGFGKRNQLSNFLSLEPDYEYYYIYHYYGKTVEEFVEKITRGDVLRESKLELLKFNIQKYFYINDITREILAYIEEKLGRIYNISGFLKDYEKNITKI